MTEKTVYLPPTEEDLALFDATIPADHYLRRVLDAVDFDSLRAPLIDRYRRSIGRPPIEPLVLLKLEFLQFHYNLSDRAVIEQSRVNLAYRFFLGLSPHSPLPHHSLLSHFRDRLGPEAHQRIFQDLIAHITYVDPA